ncbi:MAG: CPCC family cysteine-rich protein [Clostridia bacterium]|nr:CPCC family cysteine-rich protein [Clostridia bacterium]
MSKEYQPMMCPICDNFYFAELQEGDKVEKLRCYRCGWQYDIEQANNPDLKNGANSLSLNEYKAWYNTKIAETPEYDYFEDNKPVPKPHKCPVCGKFEFKDECSYDICPHCGWEDDGSEEDDEIGANGVSFTDYKNSYDGYVAANPNYKWKKDGRP